MRRLLVALLILLAATSAARAQTYLVVIGGVGGEPQYARTFAQWCATLIAAARDRLGIPPERLTYLAEAVEAPGVTARSTKGNVQRALRDLAGRAEPDATVFVVLVGHGSAVGGSPRFNLPGPDITAQEFAALLEAFRTQRIVFANLASASGGFLPVLSGARRTIVTATQSGAERYETTFGGHFVTAFAEDGADVDKDGRVSVLEAFNYARREVVRAYEARQQLLSEHALLDDNGDGRGSTEPNPQSSDGGLAMRLFLAGSAAATGEVAPTDPALGALYDRRSALERHVAELRARKASMPAEAYEQELELLLLELARVGRAIRAHEEKRP